MLMIRLYYFLPPQLHSAFVSMSTVSTGTSKFQEVATMDSNRTTTNSDETTNYKLGRLRTRTGRLPRYKLGRNNKLDFCLQKFRL